MSHAVRILLLSVLIGACAENGRQIGPIEQGVVVAARVPCVGVGPQMCLLLETDGETELVFGGIEGFSHAWGVEAVIEYHTESVSDPPADGSSVALVLDRVVTETRSTLPEFGILFPQPDPGTSWFAEQNGMIDMVGTRISCEPAVCAEILDRADTAFTVTMAFTDDPDRITALSVQ